MELRKIKVLHIITQLDLGGAQKNALDIVRLLDKRTYQVYFVSSTKGILVQDAQTISGINVILLPCLRRSTNLLTDLKCLFRLILIFKKEGIDIVHTHSSKAGILGRWAAYFARVPVVLHTVHGWSFHSRQYFLAHFFYSFLERITAAITDKLITVSKSDAQKGLRHRIGRPDQYILIRYGIERRQFFRQPIDIRRKKEEFGLNADWPLVGIIACFKPQKAPLDFVRAAYMVAKNRPQIQFLMVGDGLLRREVERLIAEYDLRKNFVLAGWRRDIAQILSCLDMLGLTSLWEGSPFVLLEAMCAKLPIVAYDIDGVSEVIKDEITGFLVPPGDYKRFASRIERLLEDKNLAKDLGSCGFDAVMNDNWDSARMLKDLDAVYKNLVQKISH